ncbi:hypothetical protein Tco_0798467 [Tanacetum coccineum]
MEKALTKTNISITSNDITIKLSKELLVKLQMNTYHRTLNEDVMEHIAKVLEMVDLIYVSGTDSHQLRMKVFPLSLADDANEWWINEGDGRITTWEKLVEKFFCRFYPESYDGENEIILNNDESKYENPPNTATNSFFKAYDICDIKEELRQGQMKPKNDDSDNKQPSKKVCKTEKFEAVKY